ncbi:50S ribosomal protein L11 methyltransferase [Pseudogemmatithrix spongiicola]|uniref:50S ribosomal protein L11 methyltransferase n=1 Tax=Pseudogemmatithrix spongiicola TaxID=3062599 RepID=A0AA49K0B0_9BACT|nr:50S ribosomal protein L11 methyltransferase [Gemmatimonadaceae bacterium 'strain 138']WKW15339.1 50S ribosomal protein L11 methyltransferase [Gemmatimonadaceae bacterium 'strain 318']
MFAAGAEGLHESGDALVTHLPESADAQSFVNAVRRADPALDATLEPLDNTDWSEKWKERITAHALGALTVCPPWLAEGRDPATTIVIEPAMAFGTGEHPTTRGVVRLMQGAIRAGDSVADLGSGSAVLAIAAAKLGAARVYAIEIDPDATGNAEENIARNGVGDRVAALEGDAAVFLPLVAPVRVILANIISSVLVDLLPLMAMTLADDGVIILSGILRDERERMLEALVAGGWRIDAEDAEDQWWSVRAVRA